MRGAPTLTLSNGWLPGIIPACAGSTSCGSGLPLGSRDHPRMCGEHRVRLICRVLRTGSSPHVRGAPAAVVVCHLVRGIIPACAGSTNRRGWCAWPKRDHPRMCGEHLSTKNRASVSGDHPRMCGEHNPVVNTATGSAGSSPHVRGALFLCLVKTWPRGIIPACAGSTD